MKNFECHKLSVVFGVQVTYYPLETKINKILLFYLSFKDAFIRLIYHMMLGIYEKIFVYVVTTIFALSWY